MLRYLVFHHQFVSIRAGNVFLVSEKRTVNGVESLPRIGVLYGTAGAWKTSAVRMGDTRGYA